MKFQPVIKLIFTLLIALFLHPALGMSDQNPTPNTLSDRIKLGVIVPLTGPLAFFGQDFVRTFNLTVEDQPDLKKYVDIIWEDSAYDSKKAVAAFNKLSTIDKVDLIYSFGGPMLNALAPLAERQKIPLFLRRNLKRVIAGEGSFARFFGMKRTNGVRPPGPFCVSADLKKSEL